MIIGTHAIVYADDADRAREFLRDILGLRNVDAGDGWLIFRLPPAEVGVHPAGTLDAGRHELYLMCDDVAATVKELSAKGAEFVADISDQGFGLMTTVRIPGAGDARPLRDPPSRRPRSLTGTSRAVGVALAAPARPGKVCDAITEIEDHRFVPLSLLLGQ